MSDIKLFQESKHLLLTDLSFHRYDYEDLPQPLMTITIEVMLKKSAHGYTLLEEACELAKQKWIEMYPDAERMMEDECQDT